MSKFGYVDLAGEPGDASGAAYASSAALTDVSPGIFTLQGNKLAKRTRMRMMAHGRFSNTGTPTLLLGFYYGGIAGVALTTGGAITTVTGAANWPFHIEAVTQIRSDGASGSAVTTGFLDMPASLTQFQATYSLPAVALPNAVTVDTTAAKTITLGAQWGTSSASNTLTVEDFTVELLN